MIARAVAGEIDLVVPDLVREELIRVLALKLGWSQDELVALDAEVRALAAALPPAPARAPALTGDPTDDRILAVAVASGSEVLVSGDRRHLLPLGEHEGTRILSPQALLVEIGSG